MDPWIIITIGAALAQTVRFMLQKQLKTTQLSTAGTTFARFVYSAPCVMAIALAYAAFTDQGTPQLPPAFFGHAVMGGAVANPWHCLRGGVVHASQFRRGHHVQKNRSPS